MIVHTLPEAYARDYDLISDWIDARFPESKPEARYKRHVNTRIEDPAYEHRELADWASDLPMIRPEILIDIPANYGFLQSFNEDRLHVPFHVVFADDQAEDAAAFAEEFLA